MFEEIMVNGSTFIKSAEGKGSNQGAFYKGLDGKEFYVKWGLDNLENEKKFQNEHLALKLYELLGVRVAPAELVRFENGPKKYIGIKSEKKPLSTLGEREPAYAAVDYSKAKVDFLLDCYLANWDVIGLGYDNLCFSEPDGEVLRLDTGGALFYRAHGYKKGDAFNNTSNEFENFLDVKVNPQASKVFSGIYEDISCDSSLTKGLWKLLSVSDENVEACIKANSFTEAALNDKLIETLSSRRKALISKAEPKVFNKVIERYYMDACSEGDTSWRGVAGNDGARPIKRLKHGGMHVARVAIHTQSIAQALSKAGYKPAQSLTEEDLFLIKVAALFHDAGRQNDVGNDTEQWEADGASKCIEFLKEELGDLISEQKLDQVSRAISLKDNKAEQERNVYALVLGAADSLDWVRSHSSGFDAKYMPELVKEKLGVENINKLAIDAKKLAESQGDSPTSGTIGSETFAGNYSVKEKKKYEHASNGCYASTSVLHAKMLEEKAHYSDSVYTQGPKNKTLPDRHLEIIFEKLLTEPDNIKYSTGDGGKIYYEIVNGDIKGDKYCLTDILEAGASVSNVQLSKEAVAKLKQQMIAETTMSLELLGVIGTENSKKLDSHKLEKKKIRDARSILGKAKEEFIEKGVLTNSKEGIAFESVIIDKLKGKTSDDNELFKAIKAEYNQIKLRALFSRASKVNPFSMNSKRDIKLELESLLHSFEYDDSYLSYGKEYLEMQRDNLDKVFIKSAERITKASIVSKTLVPDMLQKALGRAKSKIDGEDAPDLPELPVAIAPEAPVAPGPDVDDWTLTPEWVRAIRLYTGSSYQWINSLLRSKVSEGRSEENIKNALFFNLAINFSLNELRQGMPSPSGCDAVYRGQDRLAGKLMESLSILSTSRLRSRAEGFSGINKLVYTIYPAGGVDIQPFSGIHKAEQEVVFPCGNRFLRSADGTYKAVDSPSFEDKAKLDEYELKHFALNISGYPATAKHVMGVCTKLGVDLLSSGIRNGICNYFVTLIREDPKFTLNYAQSNLFKYCDYLLLFDKLDGEHELKAFLAKLKVSEGDLLIDFMINVLDNDDRDNILKKLKEVGAIDLKEERDLSIKIIDKSLSDGKFGIIDKLWIIICGGSKEHLDFYTCVLERIVASFRFGALEEGKLHLIEKLFLEEDDIFNDIIERVDGLKVKIFFKVIETGRLEFLPKFFGSIGPGEEAAVFIRDLLAKSLSNCDFESIENLLLCKGVLGKADSDLLEGILIKALESRKFTPELIQGFKSCDFNFQQKVEELWDKALDEQNSDVIDYLLHAKQVPGDELKLRVDIKCMKLLLDKSKFESAKKILDIGCVEASEVQPFLAEGFRNTLSCEDIVQTLDRMRFLHSAGFNTKQECMRVFRQALAKPDTKTLSKIRENWCEINGCQCPTISFSECIDEALKGADSLEKLEILEKAGFIFSKSCLVSAKTHGDLNLFMSIAKVLWARRTHFGVEAPSDAIIMSNCYHYLNEKLQRLHSIAKSSSEKLEPTDKALFFEEIKMFNFLNTAVKNDDSRALSALISIGFDINYIRDNEKWRSGKSKGGKYSALMWAADLGRLVMADILIKAGADLNLQDKDGYTALMWAIRNNKIGVAKMLISGGADLKLRSIGGGHSALTLALNSNAISINRVIDSIVSSKDIEFNYAEVLTIEREVIKGSLGLAKFSKEALRSALKVALTTPVSDSFKKILEEELGRRELKPAASKACDISDVGPYVEIMKKMYGDEWRDHITGLIPGTEKLMMGGGAGVSSVPGAGKACDVFDVDPYVENMKKMSGAGAGAGTGSGAGAEAECSPIYSAGSSDSPKSAYDKCTCAVS